jgi:phage terminase Nu1 subunit (DNA packaging protein)
VATNPASNLPSAPLRWNLIQAAYEFGITDDTLRKYLTRAEQGPGVDGCYATEQIIDAVYGSKYRETLRLTREQADKLALENAQTRGELLNRVEITSALEGVFSIVAQIIQASALSKTDQDDILNNIATYPVTVIENATTKKSIQAEEAEED